MTRCIHIQASYILVGSIALVTKRTLLYTTGIHNACALLLLLDLLASSNEKKSSFHHSPKIRSNL